MRGWLLAALLPAYPAFAQNCPQGNLQHAFQPAQGVQVTACSQTQPSLGKQSVYWRVKNLTADRLQVSFTEVVTTTCGKVLRVKGSTYLKPNETVGGNTFAGEISFETQVWKDDCDAKNRIADVDCENLVVKNLSAEEREKAQAQADREAARTVARQSAATPTSTTIRQPSSGAEQVTTTRTTSTRNSNTGSVGGQYNTGLPPTQTDVILNNLNRNMQTTRDNYDAITTGIQQLGALWQANRDRKRAEEDDAEERREAARQAEEARKAREARAYADRAAEIAENNRLSAIAEKREIDRQWAIDLQILGGGLSQKKTNEINGSIRQVYYLVYKRDYRTNKVTVRSYSLNKYSDDTWLLDADLPGKLQFIPYITSAGVSQLFGAYESKSAALATLNHIRAASPGATIDNSFLLLNGQAKAAGTDKNFWNN